MSENIIQKFFQDAKIMSQSGVDPGNNSSFIITTDDLISQIEQKFDILLTSEQISNSIQEQGLQILGDTGYGSKTRTLEIVSLGNDLFGLNTESNTRKVLSMYFQSFGYDTVFEFPDNVDSLGKALQSTNLSSFSKTNSRDLLAVKKIPDGFDIWVIELKGHSGVESWDFFTGFKQIQRILDFRETALKSMEKISIRCAFAVPGFPVKLHNGKHCYVKELQVLKNLLEDEAFRNSKKNKKTYEYFQKSFNEGFQEHVDPIYPDFHFLTIQSIASVSDFLSSNNLEDYLK
jgi:hypothetical protein